MNSTFGQNHNLLQTEHARNGPQTNDQAVLVYLKAMDCDGAYHDRDMALLEDELIATIERQGIGEYDGNEYGPGETILAMYAPNADRLFADIKPVLERYALCQFARIIIRYGGLGAREREETIDLS